MNWLISYLKKDWHRKVASLLWFVILMQYAVLLADVTYSGVYYLLTETIWVIYGTLILCTAVQVLAGGGGFLRGAVQGTLIILGLALYVRFLDYDVYSRLTYGAVDIGEERYVLFWTFLPYAIGAWLLYQAVLIWGTSKKKVLFALLISILIFSVTDSYSHLYLWDQVGLILIAGLLLVILFHFKQFSEKHPNGWRDLIEYPLSLIARIGVLLLVVAAIVYFTPSIRPTLMDPYTAIQQLRGIEVVKSGKGFGVIEAVGGEKNYRSGYSRDDSELGGGFEFDYTPVFQVTTDEKSYLRGETRSLYTGKGWELTDSDRHVSLRGSLSGQELPAEEGIDVSQRETMQVEQTVTVLTDDETYPVLFGAYPMTRIDMINQEPSGMENLSISRKDGSILWTPLNDEQSYPETYSIVSEIPVIDVARIQQAPLTYSRLNQMDEYLQVPESLPDRVRELAAQLTEMESSPYEKVKILEAYLQNNFTYTNEPDLSKAESGDFVDAFLFELQEGYCDYYSTALAIMTRTLGIPSRWVKGYTSGHLQQMDPYMSIPEEYMVNSQDTSGTYTVLNSDAHSWVEVYFEGFGWIPFEPTSQFSLPVVYKEAESALPETVTPELNPQQESAAKDANTKEGSTNLSIYISSGFVVLALILAAFFWRARRKGFVFRRFASGKELAKETDYNRLLISEFEKWIRFVHKYGWSYEEQRTARELSVLWIEHRRDLEQDIQDLVYWFEKAKYSGNMLSAQEWEQARKVIDKLKQALKPPKAS
ncbi:DUF3488 and DUF4129 domain-containing transglutaminase family protein [Marinicrinis lubricantis]|uniref:DUF3488 and DUF4129 domain-containing transglutaminase family protein n=1 Tax=Marinicrinis lubricantis TaxID=2086470 RepID=A0ABW1IV65_9BACL